MSGEIPNFNSAEEALGFFQSSEEFIQADFAGGTLIEHRLVDGEWLEYGNGNDPINKTEQKVQSNASDLLEHKQLIAELSERGFAVIVKGSSEIVKGTEKANQAYEPNIHGMVYILRGSQIEMHHFTGTKKDFENSFAQETWLQDMMHFDAATKLNSSLKNKTEFQQEERLTIEKEKIKSSSWEKFWNNLFKTKANENTTVEKEKTILSLFTPFEQQASLTQAETFSDPVIPAIKKLTFFNLPKSEPFPLPAPLLQTEKKLEPIKLKDPQINIRPKEPITLELRKQSPKSTRQVKRKAAFLKKQTKEKKTGLSEQTEIRKSELHGKEIKNETAKLKLVDSKQAKVVRKVWEMNKVTSLVKKVQDLTPRLKEVVPPTPQAAKKNEARSLNIKLPIEKVQKQTEPKKSFFANEEEPKESVKINLKSKEGENLTTFKQNETITIEIPKVITDVKATVEKANESPTQQIKVDAEPSLKTEITQGTAFESPQTKITSVALEQRAPQIEESLPPYIIEVIKPEAAGKEMPKSEIPIQNKTAQKIKEFTATEKVISALVKVVKPKGVKYEPLAVERPQTATVHRPNKPVFKEKARPIKNLVDFVREVPAQRLFKEVSQRKETKVQPSQDTHKVIETIKPRAVKEIRQRMDILAQYSVTKSENMSLGRRRKEESEAYNNKILRSLGNLRKISENLNLNKAGLSAIKTGFEADEELELISSGTKTLRLAA